MGAQPVAAPAGRPPPAPLRRWSVVLLAGTWETVAGLDGTPGYRDGPEGPAGQPALFNRPSAICQMPHGHLAVADTGNACIRQIDAATKQVSTLAGRCGEPGAADGPAAEAQFGSSIKSIACANCSVFVGDVSTGRLRLVRVDDAECLGASNPSGRFITRESVKWLLAGVVMLSILALGGRRYLQRHAAAVGQHLEQSRSERVPLPAGPPAGGSLRQKFLDAAHRFHLRHKLSGGAAAEAMLREEAGDEALQEAPLPPEPLLVDIEAEAGEQGSAAGSPEVLIRLDSPEPGSQLAPAADVRVPHETASPAAEEEGAPCAEKGRATPGAPSLSSPPDTFADLSPLPNS